MKKCDSQSSVKITFDLPQGAAGKLTQLAEAGDDVLKELGILSLQIEGEQVISVIMSQHAKEETKDKSEDDGENMIGSSLKNSFPHRSQDKSSPLLVNLLQKDNGLDENCEKKFRRKSSQNRKLKSAIEMGSKSTNHSHVQEFINPAVERPATTTTSALPSYPHSSTDSNNRCLTLMPPPQPPFQVKSSQANSCKVSRKRQVLINPNTGHLEPGPSESSSESEPDSDHLSESCVKENFSTSASDKALKLKLKLPLDSPSHSSVTTKRSSTTELNEGVPKIPKLILSMKDKTVKMAEKDSTSEVVTEMRRENDQETHNEQSGGEENVDKKSRPIENLSYATAFTSPFFQNQLIEESSMTKKIKKPMKNKNNSNDKITTWTKSLENHFENQMDINSWKEVLQSRVNSSTCNVDSGIDYSSLVESQKSTCFDKVGLLDNKIEVDGGNLSTSSSKSVDVGSPSHPRNEDHHGHLGEDSGIESMDALSEKSPNQGENEEREMKEMSSLTLPPPPPPPPPLLSTESSEIVNALICANTNGSDDKDNKTKDKEEMSIAANTTCEENPDALKSNVSKVSDSKIIHSSSLRSALSTSVPLGAKMVPVKLVTVSGEGNLRLVRVSPVKNVSDNNTSASQAARTVVIKSSMLKAASTSSIFNPSLISKISSTSSQSASMMDEPQVPSTSTVCLLPLQSKDHEMMKDTDKACDGYGLTVSSEDQALKSNNKAEIFEDRSINNVCRDFKNEMWSSSSKANSSDSEFVKTDIQLTESIIKDKGATSIGKINDACKDFIFEEKN